MSEESDVERAEFETAFGEVDSRAVEQAVEDDVAYARAPLHHNEVGSDEVTGGIPPEDCHLCGLPTTTKYVPAERRVRDFCELHPTGDLEP